MRFKTIKKGARSQKTILVRIWRFSDFILFRKYAYRLLLYVEIFVILV